MIQASMHRRTTVQLALTLRPQNLSGRVLSGASFQFLGVVLRTALTIGSTAILARLLMPADFGYVAMATIVTELAGLFANFGLSNILIQRKHITRRQLDTVFWASVVLGVILASAVLVLSYFASWLFRDATVGKLLAVMCWTFVLGSLTTIPWVVLVRIMRFRTEFLIQMTTMVVRAGVAIGCALAGMGAWSLVAGALAGAAVQSLFGLLAVGYFPRLRFQLDFLTSTWRTSGSYFGGGFLFYVNMNLDLILVGRQLGAEALGLYQNARSLTDEIRARIAIPLQHVLFPAFASVQSDPLRMQDMFMRSGRLIAAAVIPIGVGVAAMAQELVPVLYGQRWSAMVPLLAMLGVSAAVRASCALANIVINSQNQVAKGFRYQLISTGLMICAMSIALPFGLRAAAFAQMMVSFYALIPFYYAVRLVGLGVRDMLKILAPPAIASAVMAGAVLLARLTTRSLIELDGARLLLHAGLAALVYLGVLHAISRQYWLETSTLILRLAGRQRAA